MNAVLYTHQLEPITVVNLPPFLWDKLWHNEQVVVPVLSALPFVLLGVKPPLDEPLRLVRIYGERLRRGDHEALMLFTTDEKDALLLRAEFLPGQRGELQTRERGAFAQGFFKAIQEFGQYGSPPRR